MLTLQLYSPEVVICTFSLNFSTSWLGYRPAVPTWYFQEVSHSLLHSSLHRSLDPTHEEARATDSQSDANLLLNSRIIFWPMCSLDAIILLYPFIKIKCQMHCQPQSASHLFCLLFPTCYENSILFSCCTNSVSHQPKFHSAVSWPTGATDHSLFIIILGKNKLASVYQTFDLISMYYFTYSTSTIMTEPKL